MALSAAEAARLSASITQWPDTAPLLRGPPPENESHAFLATIAPGQAIWLTDEDVDVSQLPAGASKINAPLSRDGLPSITITPGIKTGVSTISGGEYKFLDDLGELDAWLQEKVSNGYQLFGGIFEHYVFERGESISDSEAQERALRWTWQIRSFISLDKRVYSLTCEDVNRFTEQTAFTERYVQIIDDIEADDDSIFVYIEGETDQDAADVDWAWQHGRDYIIHPNERRAIGKLNDEFISWTGWSATAVDYTLNDGRVVKVRQLQNVERGLFGTQPVLHEVDFNSDLSNKPKITSVPYAEEHPLSLLLAVYCGITLDGRDFPWGIGIDLRWIDVGSLVRYADEYRITARMLESIEANEFVQENCLAQRGILTPNARGQLQYIPTPIGQTGVPAFTIDENSIVAGSIGTFTIDSSDTAIGVQIHWNQDPVTGEFRNTTQYVEPAALRETDATEMVEIEAPYLTTGRSTEAQIKAQARVLHARTARPVKRISIQPDWAFMNSLPGTMIRVNLPVKDYQTVGGSVLDIDTPMMIGSVTVNQEDRSLSWDMVGFRELPSAFINGGDVPLDDSEYTTGGTELIVSGGVASVAQNIYLNRKYYYLGDVRFPEGWPGNLIGNGDLELWIKGTVEWAAQLNGTARGYAGGDGADIGAGSQGVQGFTPAADASGSVYVETSRFENSSGDPQRIVYRKIVSRPPAAHTPSLRQIADVVTVERGRIVGLPPTLTGSSGNGGDASFFRGLTNEPTADRSSFPGDTGYLRGSNGGRSGIGVKIVCNPGSGFVASGSMNVSGGPAGVTLRKSFTDGASGSGGARGHVVILHPVGGTPWPFSSNTLTAQPGRADFSTAVPASNSTVTTRSESGSQAFTRSFYQGTTDQPNEWADAHTVVFLKPSETTVDAFASSFDAFFAYQPDGESIVRISEAEPSDGNRGDIWITPNELANGGQSPFIQVFTDGVGYVPVDWTSTPYSAVFRSMIAIARRGGTTIHYGPTRPEVFTDGDEWHQSTTGLRYILYSGQDDVLTAEGDVQLGANKFPSLSQFPAKQVIYGGEGDPVHPTFPTTTTATGGGNTDVGIVVENPYPPLVGVSANPGGNGTTMGITINIAGDNQGATGIVVERDGVVITTLDDTAGYYLDTGLSPGTEYVYTLYYTGPNGNGRSLTDTQTTSTVGVGTSPTKPLNLVVTTQNGNNNLSWSASTDDVAVTGYNVHRDNQYLASVSTPSYVDAGNTSQTDVYTVEAYDGDSNFSERSDGATAGTAPGANPTKPQNLVVTTANGDNNLDWDDSTDDVAVTGYNVFRDNQYLASVGTSSYVDAGNTSQTAVYTVEAYDADSNFSGRSSGVTAGA